MKAKKIMMALLISCVATTGFSQIRIGGKLGMNVASVAGDYNGGVTDKQKIGFHAGVTAEYPFGALGNMALVAELLYSTQGNITDQSSLVNENGTFTYYEERNTLSLSYINMPIMFKYYVILDKLSVEGGPQFGYAVKGELKEELTNTVNPEQNRTQTYDVLKDGTYMVGTTVFPRQKMINAFDMGINLGATYDFTTKLYAQLHYYFGITDINAFPADIYSQNTFKNNNFQVSVGYKFM